MEYFPKSCTGGVWISNGVSLWNFQYLGCEVYSWGGGALNFVFGRDVRRGALKWGSKELIFFFKVRSKELKIFNIYMRAYELKFGPNLGCRTENSWNFSHRSQNLLFLLKAKWGSKELNYAATGDLKNGGSGLKRGSWVPPKYTLSDILLTCWHFSEKLHNNALSR